MRTRDNQRSKVYIAESVIHGANIFVMKDLVDYVDSVCQSKFWIKLGGASHIDIHDGRGTKRASAWGHRTISMPVWSRYESIILHELTHTLVNFDGKLIASHGPEFCKMYLVVVRHWMGKEEYLKLRASFKKNRVHYSVRRKQQ